MGASRKGQAGDLVQYFERLFAECLGAEVWSISGVSPLDVFIPSRGEVLARNVLDLLADDMEDEDTGMARPLVLASFSGGSKVVLDPIVKLLASEPKYAKVLSSIACQMFDSSPIEFRMEEGFGFLRVRLRKLTQGRLLSPPFWFVEGLVWWVASAVDYAGWHEWESQHESYWDRLLSPPFDVPTLVAYSAKDPLVSVNTVERYVGALKQAGRTVDATCYDSGHIDHAILHKEEYERKLRAFVKEACSRWGQKTAQSKL